MKIILKLIDRPIVSKSSCSLTSYDDTDKNELVNSIDKKVFNILIFETNINK